MLRPSTFRELVSGRRRGLVASTLRTALRVAEVPYTAVVRRRNHRYDTGSADVHRAAVPVVSVGNLTLGGTGKTPMVRWIAEWFLEHQLPVTVISRGYGAKEGARNDEALELAHALPDVPHLQNPDRVAAVKRAAEQFAGYGIVLDDAFQHRRLARDLDLVLLDATEPFGFGHVFPRGTLREPVEGLARAHVVALSRADMLDPDERDSIRREVLRIAPGALWAEIVHSPRGLLTHGLDGEEPIESLRGQPVAALAGIGNPAGFRHTLDTCAARVVAFREFADHHRYTPADVASLSQWAAGLDVSAVLCTHKDLVKLQTDRIGPHPLKAVIVGVEFLAGRESLEERLKALCGRDAGSML